LTAFSNYLVLPLAILFGISLVIFFYIASYSWSVSAGSTQSAPWLYSTAAAAGGSLFLLSNIVYAKSGRRFSLSQRIMLSFFDLGTFFCVSVVVLWGLIFPILRPVANDFQLFLFGQTSLAIGLYTGLILCSIVVTSRAALEFFLVRPPTPAVTVPIPQIAPVTQADPADKKFIEDSLSSIRSEIALLRAELSSLKPSKGWSPRGGVVRVETAADNSGWAGEVEPMTFPVSQLPASPISPAVHPVGMANFVSNVGPQVPSSVPPESEHTTRSFDLPDSAKDNPWASVLSGRQARAMPVMPIEPLVITPTPVEVSEPEIAPPPSIETAKSDVAVPAEIPVSVETTEVKPEEVRVPPENTAAASPIEPPNLDDVLLPNPIELVEPKPEVADPVPEPVNSTVGKTPDDTEFVIPISFEEMEAKVREETTVQETKTIENTPIPEEFSGPRPDEAPDIFASVFTEPVETKPLQEEPTAEAKPIELEPSLAEIMVWKPEVPGTSEVVNYVPIPLPIETAKVEESPQPPEAPAMENVAPPVETVTIPPPEEKKAKPVRKARKSRKTAVKKSKA
jgi:hypothetical protein